MVTNIKVRVGSAGSKVKTFDVPAGTTAGSVLERANYSNGVSFKIMWNFANWNDVLNSDTTLFVIGEKKTSGAASKAETEAELARVKAELASLQKNDGATVIPQPQVLRNGEVFTDEIITEAANVIGLAVELWLDINNLIKITTDDETPIAGIEPVQAWTKYFFHVR